MAFWREFYLYGFLTAVKEFIPGFCPRCGGGGSGVRRGGAPVSILIAINSGDLRLKLIKYLY